MYAPSLLAAYWEEDMQQTAGGLGKLTGVAPYELAQLDLILSSVRLYIAYLHCL